MQVRLKLRLNRDSWSDVMQKKEDSVSSREAFVLQLCSLESVMSLYYHPEGFAGRSVRKYWLILAIGQSLTLFRLRMTD